MADTPLSRERLQAALDGIKRDDGDTLVWREGQGFVPVHHEPVEDEPTPVEDNFYWRLVKAMYEDYERRLLESGGGPVPALRQVILTPEQYAALHEQANFHEWTVGAGGGKEHWRGLRVVVVEDALDATGIPL